MKFTELKLAIAAAVAGAFIAGNAMADGTVQPAPGSPVSYEYYANPQPEDNIPSPSDVVPEPSDIIREASTGGIAQKDNSCGVSKGAKGGCCDVVPYELFPETCRGLKIGGHAQFGYHTQGANGQGQDILGQGFNTSPNNVNLHQAWIYAEKVADTGGCGWDWGFRADYVYGIDAPNTQAFGNVPGRWDLGMNDAAGFYGHAFPQAYGEIAYNNLSLKVGHFYTIAGYEVVNATGNFFYSHAHTMILAEPFTHTGALAEYDMSDRMTLFGGWTQGWDTGFDDSNGGSTFLGGFSYDIRCDMSFTYTTTMGDFGFDAQSGSDTSAYSHSIVFDWQVTDRLNYVAVSDYVDNQALVDGQMATVANTLGIAPIPTNGKNVSFVQYLIYDVNDCWAFGGRFEWFKLGGYEINEVTLGANWSPHANLVIRPEVRVDYTTANNPPPVLQDSTTFGVDAIITF